jgi:thiol-disulfide isomerase/thioredoxin
MLARALLVIFGLATGVVAAVLIFGALYALVPPPLVEPATPSPAASEPAGSGDGDASGSPSVTSAPTTPIATATVAVPSGTIGGDAAFGIGEPAPPLRVTTLTDEVIDLAEMRGWPVWVNFMATWCPPCRDELPLMNGFATRYADTGLVVVAVDVREERDEVASFMESLGVTFPVGLDPDGTAQAEWGARALPIHFWIDASGVVRDGALGGIGPDVMAAGLRTILPGVDVQP